MRSIFLSEKSVRNKSNCVFTIYFGVNGSMKNVIDRYGKTKEEPQQVAMNPNSELMVRDLNFNTWPFNFPVSLPKIFSSVTSKCYLLFIFVSIILGGEHSKASEHITSNHYFPHKKHKFKEN
jgi:hypothetical protein